MYTDHFRLHSEPFSIAPDPRFLFLSDAHNEALAHLMYGFSHGGFVLITGEVGTGKTTLLRNLLDRTPPELDVAFILNPRLTVRELLETLCDELGISYSRESTQSVKQYIDVLNRHLLKTHQSGRSTVVIIDEAQNLSPAVLEQIRLLTNLETNDKKLLRIILLGQPELAAMLDKTELRQLAQRITARYHLTPLSRSEVSDYVRHRLSRAGGSPDLFTDGAVRALYRLSKGTPRLINVIADRSMLGAYVEGKYRIDARLVRRAAAEILSRPPTNLIAYYAGATTVVVLIAALMVWALRQDDTRTAADPATALQTAPEPQTNADAAEPAATPSASPADNSGQPPPSNRPVLTGDLMSNDPAPDISRPQGRTYELQRAAYRAVFAQWGHDYPPTSAQIPCNFAPTVGLQCLTRKGSWSEIDSLNTPVVLELWDDQSSPYYGAILRSDTPRYELHLGDKTQWVNPRHLRDSWFGTYVLLWTTPPAYNGSLRQGDRHPSVRWLHERLSTLSAGAGLGEPDDYFDQNLHNAVMAFQANEGLLADGIVGPLTWIRLSDRLNLPQPKLRQ